jgi:hypothetical protein
MNQKKSKGGKLIAFWPYDRYPYVLSGTVLKVNEYGNVETEEYGKGYFFQPLLILPARAGKALQAELKQLEKEYHNEIAKVSGKYMAMRDFILRHNGVKNPKEFM